MSRKVSFVVLLGILAVIAGVFFRVMASFALPLFLALLLVVMFRPLHVWLVVKCKGRERMAAGLTTIAILLIFLIPLLLIFFEAAREGLGVVRRLDPAAIEQKTFAEQLEKINTQFGLNLSAEEIQRDVLAGGQEWLAPMLLDTTRYAGGFLVGLCIMVVALYYFLADGPKMISTVMRLSPLDDRYERQLVQEFDTITRAVVLASVLSAIAQGLLAGFGFYLAGLEFVFVLTMLTMLFAMVPFVGAAAVWVPCCLWLYLHDGRMVAAIVLAVYGAAVVSVIDNVIKPMVLHGRSNLHPLLALLSILGGAKLLGPIGIFVGPMVVTFLYALLVMVQKEIDALTGDEAG
ncbi:MAG: AI-2E family transporter [Planctomycetia bacterium]|nr:AI-2E family transporter [Planctomycetia bacterium]